jgi:hypothetical protein
LFEIATTAQEAERCASAASETIQPSLHLSVTAALNRVRCKRLLDAAPEKYKRNRIDVSVSTLSFADVH